ncbi:PAS domain S-box protein [Nitrospira sp. Ecomares 2.1]
MSLVQESGLSALLIEDNSHERIAIRRSLKKDVHTLLECESAEEAIRHVEQSPSEFDVIIADFKLPGMDGLTLFRTLRQMKCVSPFILLTGNGSEQIAIEAFKAGVNDYLVKASQSGYLDLLPALVAEVIQHHRLKIRNELLELSLREANERFRQLMEHYQGIFWLTDFQEPRRLLYVSPTYERLWERPALQLTQNPLDWLEALHPKDRDRIENAYLKLSITGGYNEIYRIIKRDGSTRWIHERGLINHRQGGYPYRITRLAEDITDRTTMSEALKASEERFAQFMAHLPGLAYMKDEQYRLMYLNPEFEQVFNIDLKNWIGKTVHDLMPPDTASRIQYDDARVLSQGQSLEILEDIPLKDGLHQYLTCKFPILQNDRPPILGGVSIDVTGQFKAEIQRDHIFSLSLDLMCSIGIDGYLKKTNPAFEKLLGYTQEELLSQPLIFFTHPEDRISTQAAFHQLAEEKDVVDFQNRIRDIRGNYLWLEWRATPQLQEKAIYAVARDITQRYHATKALRRYEQIVSTSSDFLCFLDEENCLQAVNHGFCEYFNLPAREITGRHIRDFVGADLFETQLTSHLAECRKGRVVCFHQHLTFPEGTIRFMEVRLNPYVEPDGIISGVTAIWRDLTEQKRLEQHVRQTQKMESIGTLAGGIAHDFNNILMAILGWAEMGTWKHPQGDPAYKYFEQIGIAGKRGRDLIQQILTFSRQTEHQPRPVDLGPVIEESLTLLRATFPSNIDLRVVIHQKMNMVFADPVQIHQIIMNLCSNAEQALRPNGGTLTINLLAIIIEKDDLRFPPTLNPGRYVQIVVSDSGPGIPDHILPKIFDPFFTTKSVGKGTGMGLAVVHGIVENLRGHISVQSSNKEGTTFLIALPEYQIPTDSSLDSKPSPIFTGSGHVLMVDDEVSITEVLKEFLEHLGYTVTVRINPLEALEVFRMNPHQFDCLITDQTMPTLGGDLLSREILKIRPDMPIILCTGFSHTIDMEKALEQGISAFLYKPILLDQLSQTLTRVLSHSKPEIPGS